MSAVDKSSLRFCRAAGGGAGTTNARVTAPDSGLLLRQPSDLRPTLILNSYVESVKPNPGLSCCCEDDFLKRAQELSRRIDREMYGRFISFVDMWLAVCSSLQDKR